MKPEIVEHFPLAPLTTLGVGGPARYFCRVRSESEVVAAFLFATDNDLPVFVLGGGSNVLIADQGFEGLVVQNQIGGIEFNGAEVTAGAGEDWDEFVAACVARNLAGIECLSGIPGLVGGTPVQNVGAYGQEVSETIKLVRVFDRKSGEILELSNSDCEFGYRTSLFNSRCRERFVVLAVTFALTPGGPPKIAYRDLKELFGTKTPNLLETRDAVRKIRAEKAMLVRQDSPDARSAGSFFKNPVVTAAKFDEIVETARNLGFEHVPSFPVAATDEVKIPAAWLIEKSGFERGFAKGRAGLSSKHTLALINRGDATAAEIVSLHDQIKSTVAKRFGINLVPEPVFLGFE